VGVVVEFLWGAVSAHDLSFPSNAKVLQGAGCMLERGPVGGAAHDDADER